MTRPQRIALVLGCVGLSVVIGVAQWSERDDRDETVHVTEGGLGYGGVRVDENTMSTAREVASHSTEVPMWTNTPGFEKDVFTFCRVRFVSAYWGRRRSRGDWITDFPDSDMNLSFRL